MPAWRGLPTGRPSRSDVVVAAAVTVLEVLGLRTGRSSPDPGVALGVVGLLLSIAQGVPLLWRRQRPEAVLVVVTVCFLLHALLLDPVPPYGGWVALATLAVRRDARTAAGAAALLVVAVALGYLPSDLPAGDAVLPAVVTVVVALSAQLLRERRAAVAAHAERATVEERLRIARDLHDVLGHSLSGIAVQSSTGRLALDAGQADAARAALVSIEAASRDSMREVRAVLGVLRDDAAPGLESLDELVAMTSGGEVTVAVARHGDLHDVPGAVSGAAYRVVQEALTNVTRHAGRCRVQVALRRDDDGLEVAVDDDGRRPPGSGSRPGYGLVGMRERVTALGGRLSAGPGDDGGWTVRAWFPLTGGEAR